MVHLQVTIHKSHLTSASLFVDIYYPQVDQHFAPTLASALAPLLGRHLASPVDGYFTLSVDQHFTSPVDWHITPVDWDSTTPVDWYITPVGRDSTTPVDWYITPVGRDSTTPVDCQAPALNVLATAGFLLSGAEAENLYHNDLESIEDAGVIAFEQRINDASSYLIEAVTRIREGNRAAAVDLVTSAHASIDQLGVAIISAREGIMEENGEEAV
ncbi:hypothetical protein F4779DRAFT_643555 [Xylariaceae sp. FL0662B]|nr:hypothetical protein F4779DRAFT_643555 [Xylariaceae sp. FL0662B]